MVNPKNTFEVGSGLHPNDTYHEQAKMVVTLRNGGEVETRPVELKQGVREPSTNPMGSRADMVSKGKKVIPPISSSDPAVAPP